MISSVGIVARELIGDFPNPSAGITQIRFKGYALRPFGHPFGTLLIKRFWEIFCSLEN